MLEWKVTNISIAVLERLDSTLKWKDMCITTFKIQILNILGVEAIRSFILTAN